MDCMYNGLSLLGQWWKLNGYVCRFQWEGRPWSVTKWEKAAVLQPVSTTPFELHPPHQDPITNKHPWCGDENMEKAWEGFDTGTSGNKYGLLFFSFFLPV